MRHLSLNSSIIITATVVILTSSSSVLAQQGKERFNPAAREPLMRASVAVELIASANAQEAAGADSYAQEEEDLKKMEAELLKALDGDASAAAAPAPTESKAVVAERSAPAKPSAKVAVKVNPPNSADIKPIPHVPSDSQGVVAIPQQAANDSEQKPLEELKQQLARGESPKKQPTTPKSTGPAMASKKTGVELASAQATGDIAQKLAIAESQVKILSKELDLSRRSLSSAEERIDELASIVKSSQPTTSTAANAEVVNARGSLAAQAVPGEEEEFAVERGNAKGAQPTRRVAVAPQPSNPIDYDSYDPSLRDSSIATIVIDKAPLRVGPSKNESALYVLPRATEVTIEYRSGEWYRVITESGVRGWVYGSSLRFNVGVSPVSAVRVGGVRGMYEPVSFR